MADFFGRRMGIMLSCIVFSIGIAFQVSTPPLFSSSSSQSHLPLKDRRDSHAPLRNRSHLCRFRCWSRIMSHSHVPVRMVRFIFIFPLQSHPLSSSPKWIRGAGTLSRSVSRNPRLCVFQSSHATNGLSPSVSSLPPSSTMQPKPAPTTLPTASPSPSSSSGPPSLPLACSSSQRYVLRFRLFSSSHPLF